MRFAVPLAAALAIMAAARPAHANGRMPRTVKLVPRPGVPGEMALGVTFGLLVTKDDGATWRWHCESAVGFEGTFDPDYEYTRAGSIFANSFDGLRSTRDGCEWTAAPEPLGSTFVSSLAVGPDDAIYAALYDPATPPVVYRSTDDGATYTPSAPVGRAGDWLQSIAVAPSDASRLVATGFRMEGAMPRQRVLFRSVDAGQTWQELSTASFLGTNNSDLMFAAFSPMTADVAFVRLTWTSTTTAEAIYRTEDAFTADPGGPTWTRVLDSPDRINGFVVRQDGEVWAATETVGLRRSTDGGRTFTSVPDVTYQGYCLTEREDGLLFLCNDNLPPDLMGLARSRSGQAGTWTRALAFEDIVEPVRCAQGTIQHEDCEVLLWCGLREQLGITSTAITCTPPDAVDAAGPRPEDRSGCCGAGRDAPSSSVVLAAFVVAWLARARRAPRGARRAP